MGKEFSRSDRVAEQIRRELAELIQQGFKDPSISSKLKLVTLTDVEVTPDYKHAKVFFTSMAGPEHQEVILNGLKHSASFLRRELARRVRIHHTPELHFHFDASVERGTRLSTLIDEAVKADAARHADTAGSN